MLRNIKLYFLLFISLFILNGALAQTVSPSITPIAGAAGSDTQVQYNDSGALGANSLFTYNKTTGNLSINNYFANATSTVSAGGTTTLTASSSRYQALTGSSNQTYQLPDATTLKLGPTFVFNNNSSGSLIITNAGGSTLYTVPAGGFVQGGPTNISSANGVWDWHPSPPSTVTWGSGTTGFILNSALSSTPSVSAGTPSSTVPVFIPRRDALTTGIGAQAAGNLSLIASGTETARITSTGFKIGAGSEITSSGAGGALAAVAFSASASDLSSGTLAAARGGAGSISGILKANGSGTVSAAVAGTDYNAWNGIVVQANPVNPATTTSTVGVMMGLGATCAITPSYSTRIFISISGTMNNNTSGDGTNISLRYGSGSAPANGAANSGSFIGPTQLAQAAANSQWIPFNISGIAIGLTKGTTYWFDANVASVTGGISTLANLGCTAYEL